MIDKLITDARTENRIIEGLYILSLVKYATVKQLKTCKKLSLPTHIFTKPFLQILETEDLCVKNGEAYSPTPKTKELLRQFGKPTKHLMKRQRGEFKEHQEKLTETILNFTNDKDFFTVFYPVFKTSYGELRPDACLVFYNGAYKIQFLEVEVSEKEKAYLHRKKQKYDEIASKYETYDGWWRKWAKVFELPFPSEEEFKFTVMVVGEKTDFGKGWIWRV